MKRSRLGIFCALFVFVLVGLATGVAPAASSPSATASHAPVSGSPSAIACGGSLNAQVTLNTVAGSTGNSTNIMLVLDLSGSMAGTKFGDLKRAATATINALDAADGAADGVINGNGVGIVYYRGSSATLDSPVTSNAGTLNGLIVALPTPMGSSPHQAGIDLASSTLGTSGARAMVLITDGQTNGEPDYDAATTSANNAKANGVRIVPIGIGGGKDVNEANLEAWATQSAPSYYQSGTPGPIDTTKLISDLGAAVAVPTTFAVTETPGTHFANTPVSSTAGTATASGGVVQWTGTLAGTQTATLVFKATRDASDVFATTTELVSTLGLTVTGGTATVTPPAAISVDVLPCGGSLIAATTCTGAACSTSGAQGGTQYTVNAGAAPSGTSVVLSGLNTATPPAGTCPGFASHTTGAEFDVRPLSTDATLKVTIPKASLGTRKWFQTDVCMGTNLRFITAISSLANLAPDATFVSGGALPGRWWGLLPSIPRIAWFPGRGFVLGPYITSRAQDSAGNAVITIRVPFVANSTGLTTDGKAGYDPKFWG